MPASGEVHLWHIDWSGPDGGLAIEALIDTLPDGDAQRAERIGHPVVRRRFAICQAALRAILADYLAWDPAALSFAVGRWGKPELAGAEAASGLAFNLTHSHRLALVAVARHRDVGVDVEHLRPVPDALDLAERYFSAPEREALRRVAGTEVEALAFLQCWTRKEAYIKARGQGMCHPLDGFAVSLLPGEPARLLWRADAASDSASWTLHDLDLTPGYVGALAIEGRCELTNYAYALDSANR